MRTLACLALGLALAACGSQASLSDLRCQAGGCQDPTNPWRLRLEAEYSDPLGRLSQGKLLLRVDSTALPDQDLTKLVQPGSTLGTVQFNVEVPLREPMEALKLNVYVRGEDVLGNKTDEVGLGFVMHL